MVQVTSTLAVPEDEIQLDYIHSSGPGGQNVNKVSSAVQLHFDIRNSPALPDDVKERLIQLAGSAVTAEGVLVLTARRFRTQEQNRLDALHRLSVLIQKAAETPKKRRLTRPSAASSGARLRSKKRRGEIKRIRRFDPEDWE